MKVHVKLVCDIEVEADADGGTIGARDAIAARIEEALTGVGRLRYAELLPAGRRMTARGRDGVRYVGECDFIPCDRRGKCLDGAACAGCAHNDVLWRMAIYEDVLMMK